MANALTGRTLAHFRVGVPIGAGGMGQVYRAADTKLGRDVALKVLPEEMASSAEMLDRFQREARAVAALNHPNIVTIYSVEEADDIHFLTMELVEGQSLDRLIPPSGLGVDRIIAIATALSSALAAAHDKGIIHRDLKPANIMITTDDVVKVLDFGLAKVQAPSDEVGETARPTAMQTGAGVVMGTRPYMSPEQVQGRPVDHRTDIFSLGVVLYEITTGRRPFQGHSSAELFASILRDPVPPVTDVRPDLPAELARVIRRCLEKDPRHRIQTARDVGNELRDSGRPATAGALVEAARPASGEGSAPPVSTKPGASSSSGESRADEGFWIAVLPFKHAGGDADLAALAEGLSEEIVTGLSRFSYLRVIANNATSRSARYVMEGSLRRAGSTLRVAVQLVDTGTGAHLWAETYDRTFATEAIFALQDELVPRIVSTVADMHGVLPRSMSEAVRSKPADALSPYEAVLRSFGYFERITPEELAASRAGLESAVKKAPTYADAWAMLALLCVQEYAQGFELQADALATGLAAARRAVEAAPSSHLAYFGLAQALYFQKDLQSFRNAAERAAALNPMDGNTIAFVGEMLTYAGDRDRGLALAARAKQLNPHHPGWYWYANFYDAYRRGDDRAALDFALKVNLPGHWAVHVMIACASAQLGDQDTAGRAVKEAERLKPNFGASARPGLEKWFGREYTERVVDGLRKAGVDVGI
jgi:serine/threonine protein kinase/tetratricopeptide (TPR) repeat protein